MDYVVLAEKVDCVAKSVIESLHKFASPRRVLIVAPAAACEESDLTFAPNIKCVDENSVLLGVSKISTQAWLDKKFGKKVDDMRLGLGSHTMAGWYLQQFLKMGVAEAATKLDLSENYVLWDSDMVLLRDYCPFNEQGQVNLMEGDTGPKNKCNIGYQSSFQQLTGLPYAYSENNRKAGLSKSGKQLWERKGFTTHHMVINQKAMLSLLTKFGQSSSGGHWSTGILEASCPNLESCSCGFSEYGAYASWMKSVHPDKVAEVPLQYERSSEVADPRISCCPDAYPAYFAKKTKQRLLFVSFERSCHKDSKYVSTKKLPR